MTRARELAVQLARTPATAVAIVTAINLWILRPELISANSVNDTTVHRTLVDWASKRVAAGELPLDGWFSRIGLGFPLMHQYQTLPHLLAAFVARVIGVGATMRWSLFLLLGTWPVAVYIGCRLLRLPTRVAVVAAVLAPWIASQPSYGFEPGSYVWRGLGLWTQLFAMWLFPVALGFAWRAIDERRHFMVAALTTSLVICCHLQTGYMLLIAIGIIAIVRVRRVLTRVLPTAAVMLGALAVSSYLLVPVFADQPYSASTEFNEKTIWLDSYGAGKVLRWLATGRLFDKDHPPIITALVAIGLVVGVWRARREPQARLFLAFFAVNLCLFCGRHPFGPIIDLLPGINSLLLHRFISGVQFGGLILAALAVDTLWGIGERLAAPRLPAHVPTSAFSTAVVLALVIALFPASRVADSLERQSGRWLHAQQAADRVDGAAIRALVERGLLDGPGRFYAGMLGTNGGGYFVGSARAQSVVQEVGPTDVLGYALRVSSFLEDVEARFDETNASHYELFDVRYVVQPSSRRPPPGGLLIAQQGPHQLYRMEQASGAIGIVDTQGVISAQRDTIGRSVADLLTSPNAARQPWPVMAFGSRTAATPTLADDARPPTDPPGMVADQTADDEAGRYSATVRATRDAVVVLRSSFHPRMHALVDGRRVDTQIVAPGFVGVRVSAGEHVVQFRYAPYPAYPLWIAVGVVALIGLGWLDWRGRRRSGAELVDEVAVALDDRGLAEQAQMFEVRVGLALGHIAP